MVFQKKGPVGVKNDQAKKKGKKAFEVEEEEDLDMFEDMDDSDDDVDDDDDSNEEMEVQRTPANKTPKGRQSLSEKKVSFDLTGKNSKTPKKDTSLVAKKQPTPAIKGRTPTQGLKGKQTPQKGGDSEEDDEDDDDEDDDDLDLELDDVDDDDEDDDEDEEDDDEEDADDDDEEEEEPKNVKGQNKNVKNQNGQNKLKTPVKVEKSKSMSTPKAAQTPKSEIKKEKVPLKEKSMQQTDELERRRQRDVKMLYVGNLPKDATPAELKTLSTDILDVMIPNTNRSRMNPVAFAFLSFASEAKAEANFQILQTKKFRGQTLNIDFVGEKSKNRKPQDELKQYHPKKLFVTGIPLEATLADIAKYFPKAFQITFNHSPLFRNATINYFTEEDASAEFKANTEVDIDGHKLTVLHCVMGKLANKKNRRKRPFKGNKKMSQGGSPSKKMKMQKEDSDDE